MRMSVIVLSAVAQTVIASVLEPPDRCINAKVRHGGGISIVGGEKIAQSRKNALIGNSEVSDNDVRRRMEEERLRFVEERRRMKKDTEEDFDEEDEGEWCERRKKPRKKIDTPLNTYNIDNKARAVVCSALADVRNRYLARLDYYGLTEALFDETNGICDLRLRNVASWTTYQIVYYRGTDEIQWPLTMPKGLAKDFMRDRLIIHAYEKSISTDSE